MSGAEASLVPSERSRVRRRSDRGSHERALIERIVDEALVCHVAFVVAGEPRLLPTTIARVGDSIYLHGGAQSLLMTALQSGAQACICVTLVDAVVAGRSGFGCSLDYRSAVIFARGEPVTDPVEKERLLGAIIQDVVPGHFVRRPKPKELAATTILRFPIEEASAKVRAAGVLDLPEDLALESWAGVIPLRLVAGPPLDSPDLPVGVATPDYARNYRRPGAPRQEGAVMAE